MLFDYPDDYGVAASGFFILFSIPITFFFLLKDREYMMKIIKHQIEIDEKNKQNK